MRKLASFTKYIRIYAKSTCVHALFLMEIFPYMHVLKSLTRMVSDMDAMFSCIFNLCDMRMGIARTCIVPRGYLRGPVKGPLLSQSKVATLAPGEITEARHDSAKATLPKLFPYKLLYVADKRNKCKYLIDTGAAVSVLPKSCANRISDADCLPLVAAKNTTINSLPTVLANASSTSALNVTTRGNL